MNLIVKPNQIRCEFKYILLSKKVVATPLKDSSCETIRYWRRVSPYILIISFAAGGLSFLIKHVTNSDRRYLRVEA